MYNVYNNIIYIYEKSILYRCTNSLITVFTITKELSYETSPQNMA